MHVGDGLRLDITNMHEKSIGYSFCPECKNEWPESKRSQRGKGWKWPPSDLPYQHTLQSVVSDISMVVCEFPYARHFDADMQ